MGCGVSGLAARSGHLGEYRLRGSDTRFFDRGIRTGSDSGLRHPSRHVAPLQHRREQRGSDGGERRQWGLFGDDVLCARAVHPRRDKFQPLYYDLRLYCRGVPRDRVHHPAAQADDRLRAPDLSGRRRCRHHPEVAGCRRTVPLLTSRVNSEAWTTGMSAASSACRST
jgi:hypothetical protein